MTVCSVKNCKTVNRCGISTFRIPKYSTVKDEWLSFLALTGKNVQVEKSDRYRICEKHFYPSDVLHIGKKKCLKLNAVPVPFQVPVSLMN